MSDPVSQKPRLSGRVRPMGRGRAARSLRRGSLAGLAVLLLGSATAWATITPGAGWFSAGGNVGHFTVGGSLRGSKTLPKGYKTRYAGTFTPTCQFTSNGPTSLDFLLYNARFWLKGRERSINQILLTLTVTRDGDTETLARTGMVGSANTYEAGINLTAAIGRTNYSWQSNSGSVKTSHSGKSGSLQGVLPPSPVNPGSATGNVALKMSWTTCKTLPRL